MYIIPIKADDVTISSHMARSRGQYHQGIDLVCPSTEDPTIVAAAAGTVTQVGFDARGYGHFAIVRHANDEYTLYGHMRQKPVATQGAAIIAGQDIGVMGSTGDSSGRHLHFEIVVPPDRANFWSADPRWQYKKNPFLEVAAFSTQKYGGAAEQQHQRDRWIDAIVSGPSDGLTRVQVIATLQANGVM